MIEAEWWEYDSGAELAAAVASDVEFIVSSALEARGEALIALPGGKSPLAALQKLAKARLNWKKVTIVPTDDRLVAVDDPLSNAAMIARIFLPLGARVVPLAAGKAADRHAAGTAADARLADLGWPPDLVWLGVGADGHTASIFPGPDLDAALHGPKTRRATGVRPDPMPTDAPVDRVTLTRAAIVQARTLLLTLSGAAKREMLERAIEDGDLSALPVGRVLAEATVPVDIHWSAD